MTAAPSNRAKIEKMLKGIPHAVVGRVTGGSSLNFKSGAKKIFSTGIEELAKAYKGTLAGI